MSLARICDRCGSSYKETTNSKYVKAGVHNAGIRDKLLFMDLCEKCYEDLRVFLTGDADVAKKEVETNESN